MSPVRPGSRKPGVRAGRVAENRIAWVETFVAQFIHYTDNEAENSTEYGEEITFTIQKKGGQRISINLSDLSEEELNAVSVFFNGLVDRARPIVQQRDKDAEEAFQNGDDSYSRCYRPAPIIVDRERKIYGDRALVPQRPVGVHQVDEDGSDRRGGGAGPGSPVADDGEG